MNKYKLIIVTLLSVCLLAVASAQEKSIHLKVKDLLSQMTLEEKVGQMNQYTSDWIVTGPITQDGDKQNQIRNGQVGSMLNVRGVKHTRELQEIALQSRLKIPLLFGLDVIHGYRTIFPIPLAQAASWDLDMIEKSERIAAIEAASGGVHWTFAPMVDITRDPRWGRVMEGSGEDVYLGSQIGAARVRGFQGKGLGNTDAIMACAKHFAAYGAAVGGRDYNSVDMSRRQLWETYLPPFKAAIDAGAATVMNSFNDLNGVPATASRYLQRDILKGKWNYPGFVVSDWGSINETIAHGYSKNAKDAAFHCVMAGSDMDMESRAYKNNLVQLVKEGKVPESVVDDAVSRILQKKFELGLFDDPFKFCDVDREKANWDNREYLETARDMGRKSIVLLKNENNLLPLDKNTKTIALIGPLVKAVKSNLGFWSVEWEDDESRIVSQWDGIKQKISAGSKLLYAKGCNINDDDTSGFDEAVAVAEKADIVIMSIGEEYDMSGEAKSRSDIRIPGVQEELVKKIVATGKPVVVMINAGRPLTFEWISDHVPTVMYTWWLGTQAGNSIADVLFGDYNPSGKLPMTFPRTVGQVPIYYDHYRTGRPALNDSNVLYKSAYIDLSIYPKYPFGYGLSYTTFVYSDFSLSADRLHADEKLTASVKVENTGNYDGEEVVQLYIRDLVASVVRPVKELKGFQKIMLKKGESKTVTFEITPEMLKFYNSDLVYDWEPGEFEIMIGTSSRDVMTKKVNWEK